MKFGKKYPKNILLLRYEDFCFDPYDTVDRLIKFLKLKPVPELIDQYIESHTGKTRSGEQKEVPQDAHDDPMGFVKNSALKPFEWKSNINNSTLHEVEEYCAKPMKDLGYAEWNPEKIQILIKSAIEVWPFS